MQVILKPVIHPELGEIIIKDDLFPIGRLERPFADYDPGFVEKLSRRHARIFEQDGVVYIADLGSLNGTTVNETSVDSLPVRLKRGDQICFTAALCYEIEILGAAANRPVDEPAVPVQVVLTPEHSKLGLEPIVVTQFPFLINKSSDVFTRYKDTLSKEISYISRRHAHLFLKGSDVYVEDLGSTNGTFVSGERLEEHCRKLNEGDLIAFGGDQLVYRVGLLHIESEATSTPEEAAEILTSTSHTLEDATRTTFVTSANSFLDIFCVEEDSAEAESGAHGGSDSPGGAVDSGTKANKGLLQGPRVFLGEIKTAFASDKKGGTGKFWLAACLVAGIVLAGLYLGSTSKREIHQFMDNAEYAAAAAAANRYLEDHRDSEEIRDIATEAVLKEVVPGWVKQLAAGDFDAALQTIERGKRLSYANPDGEEIFNELVWVTALERFVSDRNGVEKPVIMFMEEEQINTLVNQWEQDPKAHRRSLATLAQQVPEFVALREQVFSHLRALQNQQSLSVAAIERLVAEVESALENGTAASLQPVLEEFEKTYPRIKGIGKLHGDLEKYLQIANKLKGNYWLEAHQLATETQFETPLFADRMQRVREQQLPPQATLDSYQQAQMEWRQGDSEAAIATLEPLTRERWGEVAKRRLAHYQQVLGDFRQLEQARDKSGYDRRLLEFYRTLDPVEDDYFIGSVEQEFKVHRSKALDEAKQLFGKAEHSWKQYQAAGGIRGQHRLEAGVSKTYRQRASELTTASESMVRAMEINMLLKVDNTTEWIELHDEISNEVRLQRQSLTELQMVLKPSLRQAKLELLPLVDQ
ncbi:FHA domain-containing protein [Pseudomonadota bacterium]